MCQLGDALRFLFIIKTVNIRRNNQYGLISILLLDQLPVILINKYLANTNLPTSFLYSVVLKHLAERDISKSAMDNLKSSTKRIDGIIMKHLARIIIDKKAIDNLQAATDKLNPAEKRIGKSTDTDDSLSAGSAAGIVIASIAVLVIVVGIVVARRNKMKRNAGFKMQHPNQTSYTNE